MSRYSPQVLPGAPGNPYETVDRIANALHFAVQEGERRSDRRRQLARENMADHVAGIRQGDVPDYAGPAPEEAAQAFRPGDVITAGGGAAGVGGAAALAIARADAVGRARHDSQFVRLGRGAYLDTEATPEAIAHRRAAAQRRGAYEALRRTDPEGAGAMPFVDGFDYNPQVAAVLQHGREVRLEDHRSTNRRTEATHGSGLKREEMGVEHGYDVQMEGEKHRNTMQREQYVQGQANYRHTTPSGNTVYSESQANYRHSTPSASSVISATGGRGAAGYSRDQAFDAAVRLSTGWDADGHQVWYEDDPQQVLELADRIYRGETAAVDNAPGAPGGSGRAASPADSVATQRTAWDRAAGALRTQSKTQAQIIATIGNRP